jgi:integrase
VRQGALNATSINATIKRLAQILDLAIEYCPGVLAGNPARGRRPRLKAQAPTRTFLGADQLRVLLDAAGELDRSAHRGREHVARRAILATLALAGLRIGELAELRWQDVHLAGGYLAVRHSKTAAGVREVEIGAFLRDELAIHRARTSFSEPGDYVFAT